MRRARPRGQLVRILAWRRFVDRPLRSAMTGAGVALGVAFLFAVLSLNAQLASHVHDTAALIGGPRMLQVTPSSPGGLPEGLAAELAADERVAAAAPVVLTRAKASNGDRETGMFVLGITADAAALAPDAVDSFDVADLAEAGDLVVGRHLAERLDLTAGDQVAVHASTGIQRLTVGAVVSSRLVDRINGGLTAAMPLAAAQELFGRSGRVDQVLLRADEDADLDALQDDLATELDGRAVVGTPGADSGAGSTDFAAVQAITSLMGAFVLFVAVILVFHTMSMASAERRTEIALARSLGSSRRQLLLVTLLEAAFVGVAGAVVGLVAGGALAWVVLPVARFAYGGTAPVDVPTGVSLQIGPALVAAAAGVIGTVAGALVPARAAARAAPIDAFRPAANFEWRDPQRSPRQVALAGVGAILLVGGWIVALGDSTGDLSDPKAMAPTLAVFVGTLILVPMGIPFVVRFAAALLGRTSGTTGRFAGDALRANPRRTTITVVALLLPVTTVIVTIVTFDAGRVTIGRLARAGVTAPLNVDADSYVGGPGAAVASQPMAPEHQAVLEAVPGVQAVLPHENATLHLPDGSNGVVYAVPVVAADRAGVPEVVGLPSLAADPAAFRRALADGQVAASRYAARSLDLEVGGTVTLPTPSGPKALRIGGVFDDWAFQGTFAIDLDTYRTLWGDESAFRFAIVPAAGTTVDELQRRLERVITDAAIPAQVDTREEGVEQLQRNTASLLPLMRAISLASLVFSVLALANATYTTVTERRWSFALQRSLGMTNRQITRSLGLEAVVIGLIGAVGAGVLGVALSVLTTRVLGNQLAIDVPYYTPWAWVIGLTFLGVAIALSATAYPRRMARRTTIVEALRFSD